MVFPITWILTPWVIEWALPNMIITGGYGWMHERGTRSKSLAGRDLDLLIPECLLEVAPACQPNPFQHPRRVSLSCITLTLAYTYRLQGRIDDAGELEDAVSMDVLGQTRWMQGRCSKAKMLQEHAVNGLTKLEILGPKHEDTLGAIHNLGRSVAKLYEHDEAERLFKAAWDRMIQTLGPNHVKTLLAKEDLATHSLLTERNLPMVVEMLEQVFENRREKLGKEHPYTLVMVNWARVRNVIGEHDEAEMRVRSALPIAYRNLGEGHIGALLERAILGSILIRQSKFAEAESTLLDVIEKQCHICHISSLQGKLEESDRVSDDIIEGLQMITWKEHPLERQTRALRLEMVEAIESKRADAERDIPLS
ncbi:hypothetical protein N7492_004440 [Penicillium capsulatum]|uniref:Kinesin light chain n=1 Tax=Penicillium capsulatum TaxID=69766 RepID=A0A9W9IBK5_9EURO|nr:hypothetical protein N7492_004440 [Penicillium capsulatum]KAJ6136440.1 hypothetical protein N7512_001600 [Penicillium capsulatum]